MENNTETKKIGYVDNDRNLELETNTLLKSFFNIFFFFVILSLNTWFWVTWAHVLTLKKLS